MDLRDYYRTLRKRWPTTALCLLVAVGLAAVLTAASGKQYTSTASVFVSARDSGSAGIDGALQGSLFAQDRVKSYARVAQSSVVTRQVASRLRLAPDEVAGKVSADSPDQTVIIDLSVTDSDPRRAQAITAATTAVLRSALPDLETPPGAKQSPIKVTVTEPADLPGSPSAPRPALNLFVGVILGLIAGGTAAVLQELLDTRIKTKEELQRVTGSAPLGQIREDREMAQHPLVVQADSRSPRAEAYRQLRTNLQYVDVDKPLGTIVITSALPGEGKSATACNLAITLAEAGVRTALVEADLRRPRMSHYLGIEGAVGLTSVLTGKVSLSDATQPWGTHGLLVLPSGPLPPNPSELLGSEQMRDLLHQLRETTDIVILDTPPMLPVTDAAVLSRMADGALLVVRSRETKRDQVLRCLELLDGVDSRLLGTVLNRTAAKGVDASDVDGFDYGYYTVGDAEVAPDPEPEGPGPVLSSSRES